MKRLSLCLIALTLTAAAVGCCSPCGSKCGTGTSFFGPVTNPLMPGGCPNGNCGLGAAPATVYPQGTYVVPESTQAMAPQGGYSMPTTAQTVAPGYSPYSYNQTAAVPMQTVPTY
ncbi:hypothetical protein [Calycomorphotria hydatis]|uniref:Uncharacterized protein n=1 Tax=Calycomorphotria hydatis TaxID=2528027 RepID=A0A517T783_9PLAN|nr:hypothetical protein [Calycomorphotria hydatis]QDT64231.1 hypothetical protein V22_14620 [Calycomorphotria hydatis]